MAMPAIPPQAVPADSQISYSGISIPSCCWTFFQSFQQAYHLDILLLKGWSKNDQEGAQFYMPTEPGRIARL